MQINVIGLGYIGLPTALMMAANGNVVIGTDRNQELIAKLNRGEITFAEDGLGPLFKRAVANKICFTSEYCKADVYIVAVPTPYLKRDKKVDASYVKDAVGEVLDIFTGILHGYTTLQLRCAFENPNQVRERLSNTIDTILLGVYQKYK